MTYTNQSAPVDLNATVWLHHKGGVWFAAARVHGHVDLIPISDALASILRDRWQSVVASE